MGRPKKRMREESSTTLSPDSSNSGLDVSSTFGSYGMPNVSAAMPPQHYQDVSMIPPIPWSLDTTNACTPAIIDTTFPQIDATLADIDIMSTLTTSTPPSYMKTTTCNCIAITSLALETLQSMTAFHFPSSLGGLRNIMSSLSTVIDCSVCPTQRTTSLQNSLLLQTTLSCLAEKFQGLLFGLEQEYQRLIRENERPKIRVGDPTVPMALHSGSPECYQGFNISLEPDQWKQMARKELMTLLKGPDHSLAQLIRGIQQRQIKWHADPNSNVIHMKHPSATSTGNGDTPNCVVNLGEILNQIDKMT